VKKDVTMWFRTNRDKRQRHARSAHRASAVLLVLLAAGGQLVAGQAGQDHGGKYSQTRLTAWTCGAAGSGTPGPTRRSEI
jgi:hypothetical protein